MKAAPIRNRFSSEFLLAYPNPGTRQKYEFVLRHLFDFIQQVGGVPEEAVDFAALLPRLAANGEVLYLTPVDKEFTRAFIEHRRCAGDSTMTLVNHIRGIRKFFEFLVRRDVLQENPARCLKVPHTPPSGRIDWLTEAEVSALLSVAEHGRFAARDKAMLMVMGALALCPQETVGLMVWDVQAASRRVLIHHKAKRNEAYLGLPDAVRDAISQYLADSVRKGQAMERLFLDDSGRPYTTESLRHWVKALARAAGITRSVTPYTLRHTAATLFVLDGASIIDAKALLRHEDLRSTRYYTHGVDLQRSDLVQRGPVNHMLGTWLRSTFTKVERP